MEDESKSAPREVPTVETRIVRQEVFLVGDGEGWGFDTGIVESGALTELWGRSYPFERSFLRPKLTIGLEIDLQTVVTLEPFRDEERPRVRGETVIPSCLE